MQRSRNPLIQLTRRRDIYRNYGCQFRVSCQQSPMSKSTTTKTRFFSESSSSSSHSAPKPIDKTIASRKSSNLLPMSVVTSPSVEFALPFIGHAAYIILTSGFLMTDMLYLRVVLAAGYTGLVAFHALHPRPLRIPLAWSALFILVNAGAAGLLIMDRYAPPVLDNADDELLYDQHFAKALTRGQFYQLLQLAHRRRSGVEEELTVEGHVCPHVYFLERGSAKICHHQSRTATIEQGGFVNDVAFSQGPHVGAYGTVVTTEPCTLLVWDQLELREHLRSRPEMNRNMKYLMSEHLVKSLLRQREAVHQRAERLKSRSWWFT